MLYDSLLVLGVLIVATFFATYLLGQLGSDAVQTNNVVHELNPGLSGIGFQAYLILVTLLFFLIFWMKSGQTLGMQAWRIKLVSDTGGNVRISQCLLRFTGACFSAALFGVGYLWSLYDSENKTWHDKMSKTHLILLPKKN